MFFFPRSGRLELLRTAHAGEFDRPKTGNYDSDRQVTDCGRLDTKPAFLIGGRLIGASLVLTTSRKIKQSVRARNGTASIDCPMMKRLKEIG